MSGRKVGKSVYLSVKGCYVKKCKKKLEISNIGIFRKTTKLRRIQIKKKTYYKPYTDPSSQRCILPPISKPS